MKTSFFKVTNGIIYICPLTVKIHLRTVSASFIVCGEPFCGSFTQFHKLFPYITKKHVGEADTMFTKALAGKGLSNMVLKKKKFFQSLKFYLEMS